VSGWRLRGAVSEGLGASLDTLRACSACAGDYEDPDRTAWPLDVENEEAEVETEVDEEVGTDVRREVEANVRHTPREEILGAAREDAESGGADDEFPAKED